ncbi:P-loop NTPase fold protein [Leptospira santarosai]|uniref:P-loop NTPase fold protein n=1 Tax=Leptospira santarosai TaxID=28183 RepID=UPI0026E220FC|nr:P-loop NTPase fold protein [Leptospira santarosai]MDO6384148.1 P-loop NTPase fold protein [Leptospira santarosai]
MLVDALLNYISEENTDYALMVTGEWGSGKSYFIASEFKDVLKNKFKETKFINVSLNGLQSLEEIYPKILAEVINYTGKGGRITFGLAKVLLDLDIEIPKIGLKSKTIANALKNSSLLVSKETSFPDAVLCFDDLERISKGIPIESVLGFIHSNFIEQKKMKVILICDESKIKSDDYKEIKEKIVARTYLFKSDISLLLPKLAESISSDIEFLNLFNEEQERLINFIRKYKVKNLRTIKFILNVLKVVILQKPGIPKTIFHRIAYFIYSYANEYKLGAIQNNSKPKLSNYSEYFLIKSVNKSAINSEEKEKEYIEEFYSKYIDLRDSEFLYVDAIADLILEGFLDIGRLSAELAPYYSNSKPIHLKALDRIINFEKLSEVEFQDSVSKVINHMDYVDYSVDQFLIATFLIFKFIKADLLLIDPMPAINKSKDALLEKIKNPSFLQYDLLETIGIYLENDKPEMLKSIAFAFKEAIEESLRLKKVLDIRDFFRLLSEGDDINAFIKYDNIKHENSMMAIVPIEDITGFLSSASNDGLHQFKLLLKSRYLQYQNIKGLHDGEKETLERLSEFLKNKKDLEQRKLRRYLLSEIEMQVEAIRTRI